VATRKLDGTAKQGHAVVIGGSLAGLLAARAMADHFTRVTLVERDGFPEGPLPRKSVPQSRHVHVLLLKGLLLLEEFFPGFTEELTTAGATVMDTAQDFAWLTPAGWGPRFRSGLEVRTLTRDLLDWLVRRRLARHREVCFLENTDVVGLLSDQAGTGIAGVAIRPRHTEDEAPRTEKQLEANFVVDASGRHSRAPQWLKSLGYPVPRETIVNAFLGYASRLYRPPAGFKADWLGMYLQVMPPDQKRAGVIFPVEGGRWMVTLGGGGKDYPPIDEVGFLDFSRSLRSPILYEAIRSAEPLTPLVSHRATENRVRHYEQLERWPGRFVVLGDAACAFNPVYGQGMTTAALGARALGQCLASAHASTAGRFGNGLARRFQKTLARINRAPWLLATGEDYRYRETEGEPPGWSMRLKHRFLDEVIRLSTKDTAVRLRFLQVFHMLKPPTTLFRPGLLAGILRQAAFG
jgi:2-polyprenyl-6-methoxyphenol hydroxylase-like FAD-dependent oxidoreductase